MLRFGIELGHLKQHASTRSTQPSVIHVLCDDISLFITLFVCILIFFISVCVYFRTFHLFMYILVFLIHIHEYLIFFLLFTCILAFSLLFMCILVFFSFIYLYFSIFSLLYLCILVLLTFINVYFSFPRFHVPVFLVFFTSKFCSILVKEKNIRDLLFFSFSYCLSLVVHVAGVCI